MITFDYWTDIPDDFEGHCYAKNYGTQYWYTKYKTLHNNDGPAIIKSSGPIQWFKNGKCHRLGGPAITNFNGREHYYIYGEWMTPKEYWEHPLVIEYKLNSILDSHEIMIKVTE